MTHPPAAPAATAIPATGVDALLLDAGGVLLRPDPAALRAALGAGGVRPDDDAFDRALYRHGPVGAGLGPGDDDDAFVLSYAVSAGVPLDRARARLDALRQVVLFRPWVPRDPRAVRAALTACAARVPHVVVVTNSEGGAAAHLARAGVCQVGPGAGVEVRLVVDSAEVGVHKPDPGIYRHAAEAVGVAPERCLHVGDSVRNDVAAATAAGMAALHFCPFGDCRDTAHGHVRSLAEVAGLLSGAPA
ncbi:HAD family hydrolase [Streptomonospora sp. S1-112]|uniref:HAD family hydrolase n=1 Tax=Streptomonospora mangrovi TaxID=2883123 RepID=A0A9X3SLX2_9ACTN|nr:HAD family hydrolase [Streptomonospora mangrovi]MDA0563801.1 HAD family hydrolase [Streptomonospora mangrovi]